MRRRALRLWLPLALILAVAVPVPAGANHNADQHEKMKQHSIDPNSTGATNSDLAFWGNKAFAGNYNGFRIFDITGTTPKLITDFPCFGPQNDISVWDRDGDGEADILFTSVDSVLFGPACGTGAVPLDAPDINDPSSGYWEGIRIFDISDPANPVQIGDIYQDCGSHTHTLVPDPEDNRVLLYNASYTLRWGPTCGPGGSAVGHAIDHGVIQISEVSWDPSDPLGPVNAVEIAEPPINYPGDPDNTFDPSERGFSGFNNLRACHDIAVYMPANLVAGACAEQGQLWELDPVTLLPDTANPIWITDDEVSSGGTGDIPGAVDFFHSATFSWDGEVVNWIDESFGAGCPPTTDWEPRPWNPAGGTHDTGRMFFHDAGTGTMQSEFMIDRPEEDEYCSAHLGIPVPAKNRYLLVNAWYLGGADVIDFTDPTDPKEIAFYDSGPSGPTGSDNWSAYWYERHPAPQGSSMTLYGSDGVHAPATGRGFVVWKAFVGPTKRVGLPFLNPQTQMDAIG